MHYDRTMTKSSVMVQLEPGQIEALDERARREGISRSHLIRRAVDELLDPPQDPDIAAQYAAAYPDQRFGADEWGDLDAWHDAAEADRSDDRTGTW